MTGSQYDEIIKLLKEIILEIKKIKLNKK